MWLLLFKVGLMYLALILAIYWHEIGHLGKSIYFRSVFPIPVAASVNAKSRYGGLVLNFLAALVIWLVKPANAFIMLFGFMNWLHFVLYMILGSFNRERVFMNGLNDFVYDDVNNKYWILNCGLGIAAIVWMGSYYWLAVSGFLI